MSTLFAPALCLRKAAVGLGATLGLPRLGAARTDSGDFAFVVITDLHYRDERCGEYLRQVASRIRNLHPRPAFVVLAGDLSEGGKPGELRAVREIFHPLPMPVRTIIGNHDYEESGARSAFEAEFGSRLNYEFTHAGWQFLALDTTERRSVYRTRIPVETFRWLDTTLPTLSPTRPTIILTHFPLGRNWLRPVNTKPLLERMQDHHLVASFSGHWHGLTERLVRGSSLSTGRCCSWWRGNHDGSAEKGFTLCQVTGGEVRHEFIAVPIPFAPTLKA